MKKFTAVLAFTLFAFFAKAQTPIGSMDTIVTVAGTELMIAQKVGEYVFKSLTPNRLRDYITPKAFPGSTPSDNQILQYDASGDTLIWAANNSSADGVIQTVRDSGFVERQELADTASTLRSELGQPISTATVSSGSFSITVSYSGSTTPTLSTSSVGDYTLTIPTSVNVLKLDVDGTNSTVKGDNSLELNIDNSANSFDVYYQFQIISRNNNQVVNRPDSYGITVTQVQSANVNTITFPAIGGFGSSGFKIMLR